MKMRTVAAVICVLSGALSAAIGGAFALAAFFTPAESASIGIIGGADGPTAIFLTGQLFRQADSALLLALLPAVIFLVSGVLWLILHLRSRKNSQ